MPMPPNPNKLLLISCYFPPVGGIQVQRALSLARYLPDHGFEVHVLTVRNPAVPNLDPALLSRVPSQVRIHRAWTLEPPFAIRKKLWNRIASPGVPQLASESGGPTLGWKSHFSNKISRLLCPDPQVLWYPAALRRACQLVRREAIGTVIVTVPPFSSLLIANELKRRFPQIQLITDIRDEWLEYFVKKFAFRNNSYVREQASVIERQAVELSTRVVAVTRAARDVIRNRYPEQPDGKFKVIRNGYDPEAFASFTSRSHAGDDILVTYLGTVYEPANPSAYLDSVDRLPDQCRRRFLTRFVGRVAEEFDRSIFSNRQSRIELIPFVPHHEAVGLMEQTDFLLLPWSDRLNVPGKALEYLATGKLILAFAPPDGELADILRRTRAGFVVPPEHPTEAAALLLQLASTSGEAGLQPNRNEICRFARTKLIGEYARLLRERA